VGGDRPHAGSEFTYGLAGDVIDFRVFDIYDPDTGDWSGWALVEAFCDLAGLRPVPVLAKGKMTREEASGLVEGLSSLDKKTMREGVVVRFEHDARTPRGGRAIVKWKSPKFLLKHG